MGVPATKLEVLPVAGRDLVRLFRVSTARGATHAQPAAEASGEDPDVCYIAGRKLVVLPRTRFPGKTLEALISHGALGI